jgi:hypothetical protein
LQNAPKAYAITLKNVDQPGLPPATVLSDAPTAAKSATVTSHTLSDRKADLASVDDTILNESVQILADYVRLAPRLDWQ